MYNKACCFDLEYNYIDNELKMNDKLEENACDIYIIS
jgi:hypothetical protein